MTDLADLSARELAARIRRREVSPVDAMRSVLAREEARRGLNAFATVATEQALEAARRAERQVADGAALPPLHGVPFSVKDLTLTAGIRTTMGSALYEHFVPAQDALPVARAKAAGALLFGKTTTPEFGHKQAADAPLFGRTLNPFDARFTCGASSAGAAVALAAGIGPLALGTDGGGSIRIPASCCGVVGLKPTLGAVANLQPPDLFGANSYVGPMARDVADCSLLFEAIRGFDRRDPFGQAHQATGRAVPLTLAGLKVAWLPRCGNRLDPEVDAATTAAVRAMERDGAAIETIELDFVALERHFIVVLESTLAARIGPQLEAFESRLDPSLVGVVRRGRQHGAVALQEAQFARTRCFGELQALFERFDVLVSPTVSAPPLPVAQDPHGTVVIAGEVAGTIRGAWYPYTYPMNLTGHPALSMPCGKSTLGLPIGLQLAGRWHDDRFVLGVAALLERVIGG